MPNTDTYGDSVRNDYARFIILGFTFVLILAILTVAGFFLDRFLGTLPLFLLVGLGIGFAGGLYYMYVALQNLDGG
jgi:ATP synthase protein I